MVGTLFEKVELVFFKLPYVFVCKIIFLLKDLCMNTHKREFLHITKAQKVDIYRAMNLFVAIRFFSPISKSRLKNLFLCIF